MRPLHRSLLGQRSSGSYLEGGDDSSASILDVSDAMHSLGKL